MFGLKYDTMNDTKYLRRYFERFLFGDKELSIPKCLLIFYILMSDMKYFDLRVSQKNSFM